MKSSMLRCAVYAVLGLALATSSSAIFGQAEDPEAYGDEYQAGDYGRIRYLDGGATIVRAGGDEVDDRTAQNAPLFPGDRIETGREQRIEIQLAGGTTLRLDRDTALTLQSLPRPYSKYRDNTVLQLDRGVVRVDARTEKDDEFRIDTRAGSVYLLGEGDFRIEADPGGRTRVISRRGVAEVVGEGGSVLVRGGSRTSLDPGALPDDPRPHSAYAADGFDRWVESRDDAYRSRDRYESAGFRDDDLPYEVRPYARELSIYGSWVNVPDYGWAWYPSDVGVGWRPYHDGYWDYGPHGYFWVGHEPWGWAPYRYGRWSYVGSYGWCWIPGRVFGGAWVSWSWGSVHFGWAPLDFWGRPAFLGGIYRYGYYDPGCWTFLDYRHIVVRDVRRHAVPIARVGDDVRGRAVVVRAPQISPRKLAESRDWRERAARQAVEDTRYRVRPVAGDRPPASRLPDVEDRLVRRTARTPQPGDGREIRAPGRDVRPAPRVPSDRVAPERREPGAVDRAPARDRVNPGGRAPAAPAGDSARERFPRRIVEDPRAQDRGRENARPDEAATPDRRRSEAAPRDTNDRVRDLYDRLSRPREMRESQPPRAAPEREGANPETRRQAPERPQRVEPRREGTREAPRAQPGPRPREQPKAQPRAQPREQPRAQPREQPRSQPRAEPARPAPKENRQGGAQKKDRR